MSNFIPEGTAGPSQGPTGAVIGPPTEADRALAKRVLRPELFSDEILAYIVDYLGVNQPMIPISQISGFAQRAPLVAPIIATQETTTSTTYTNLATVGPTLTGIPAGTYLLLYGALLNTSTGAVRCFYSPKINSTEAVDADAIQTPNTVLSMQTIAVSKTLTAENNTITMRYKMGGAATGTFDIRWLIALRQANA